VVAEAALVRLRIILIMAVVVVGLGVAYLVSRRGTPEPAPQTPPYVWKVEMLELERIAIALPPLGKAESWVRHADKYWYFDRPDGPRVDIHRWGGGIPVLLSGPRANRVIAADATDEELSSYGLDPPRMTVSLSTERGEEINLEVGTLTPTGQNRYIRIAGSRDVYSVDYTWYDILERLVTDPPYAVVSGQ
jgi:hypothetical protein